MTTDFRTLCAELADELTQFNAWYIEDNGYGLPNLEALLRRCDAALADGPAVPAPPADGEVAELVEWLRSTRAARLTRAAELLQRQALVPVSVSERLPGRRIAMQRGGVGG